MVEGNFITVEPYPRNFITADGRRTLDALESMHRAVRYLATQFHVHMSRPDAEANLQSRELLIVLHNQIVDEKLAELKEAQPCLK